MCVFFLRLAAKAPCAAFAGMAAILGVGGCANFKTATYAGAPQVSSPYVAQGPSVPLESDGLPVQAAPSTRIRQLPDDPSQPFSPNYGGPNPASTIPGQSTVKTSNDKAPSNSVIPDDLPPTFRRQLVVAADVAG